MTLPELIHYVKETEGITFTDMVERAHAADPRFTYFSKALISKIMRRGLKTFPRPDTIFALAAALDRSPYDIMTAIGEYFEIHWPADDPHATAEQVLRHYDLLQKDRQRLIDELLALRTTLDQHLSRALADPK